MGVVKWYQSGADILAEYAGASKTLTSGATTTVDASGEATLLRTTLTQDTAFSLSGLTSGRRWVMEVKQDATGGRKATWSGVTWVPTGPPALTTTANAADLFEFVSPDGSTVYGFQITTAAQLPGQFQLATRLENMPRDVASTVVGLASGFVIWTHFPMLDHDVVVSNILTVNRGTAASGGTLGKLAVATVSGAAQDTYTVKGRTASSASRWSANGLDSTATAIVDDGAASPQAIVNVTLRAGDIPAVGALFIGTTAPQLEGSPKHATDAALLPRLAATSSGAQTDIAATYATLAASGSRFWAALT